MKDQKRGLLFENSIFANSPSRVIRPGGLRLTRRLLEYCTFEQGAKVVDIGCGAGITVQYLRDAYNLCAMGIDLSEQLLQQARERVPDLPILWASGDSLPFPENSFEGVIAECSLSVMEDANKVLAECGRILISGGKLAITDMYLHTAEGDDPLSGKTGVMTYAQFKKTVEKNGFNIIVWEDQSIFLKEFVACFIMEHGLTEELWQCVLTQVDDRKKLGYFLSVAEKRITGEK
jgi:SAM-dependent methyltransferase